jgi:hypothetical protein
MLVTKLAVYYLFIWMDPDYVYSRWKQTTDIKIKIRFC